MRISKEGKKSTNQTEKTKREPTTTTSTAATAATTTTTTATTAGGQKETPKSEGISQTRRFERKGKHKMNENTGEENHKAPSTFFLVEELKTETAIS